MNEAIRLIASFGNGFLVNCEKNFQFAGSSAVGIWNPAYTSPQLPTCVVTWGLPTDRIGASNSFASSGDPSARTAKSRIWFLWISTWVPRRLSEVGAVRCHASKTPCRSPIPAHVACTYVTLFSGAALYVRT